MGMTGNGGVWARFRLVPGWELVSVGLDDLAAGRETVPALLVLSASHRLRQIGLGPGPSADEADVPSRLYALIEADVGPARAHGRYNALRRRLSSFLRAAADAPGA